MVYTWGANDYGELGNHSNSTASSGTPTAVEYKDSGAQYVPLTDIVCVGTSSHHVLASNDTVWAWGANEDGQLGDGQSDSMPDFDSEPNNVLATDGGPAFELYLVHNRTTGQNYATIQAAVEAASPNDVIEVDPGTYYELIDFGGKDITLRSTDPDDWDIVEATVIDGENAGSVVTFDGTETGDAELSGFTITHGRTTGYFTAGAGIRGRRTHAAISKCIISDNFAASLAGGGGGAADCSGEISDCMFLNNSASDSGGGALRCSSVINCVFEGNSAVSYGGGATGVSFIQLYFQAE